MLAVLGLHGGAVFWLRDVNPPKIGLPAPAQPILLELAPAPAAPLPAPDPPPLQPAPPQTSAEPQPPEPPQALAEPPPPEPPPPPQEAILTVPRPPLVKPMTPRPVVRQVPRAVQPEMAPAQAPSTPAAAAPVRAAPPPGAVAARWESAVSAYIARFRQYPVMAQRRGDEGVALLHFAVDHAGNVSSVVLIRSSGHPDLDREATAWVMRAQPVPPPPPEITQSRIELVIPMRFALH